MSQSTAPAVARKAPPSGLFIGSWEIGNLGMPGAPILTVDLMFYAPMSTVTGHGRLSQAVNPPLEVDSRLSGNYTYMTVMPQSTHVLITLTGYPNTKWVGPVLEPNMEVRMVLEADWHTGTATYSYRSGDGEWSLIESVPVRERTAPVRAGE
jgi:Domain of unknown function (DUF1842)